jgi:hypothetical protein
MAVRANPTPRYFMLGARKLRYFSGQHSQRMTVTARVGTYLQFDLSALPILTHPDLRNSLRGTYGLAFVETDCSENQSEPH